jgi:hypothetical protein
MGKRAGLRPLASIAAMPKLRPLLLALALAGAFAGLLGCGGSSGPDPSIPADNSQTLLAKIQEIQANVDVGSCLVAADKTDDLIADVQDLPSDVNPDVRQALESGANNLKLLLSDPSQCESRSATTTSTPSTTESTTESTTSTNTKPSTTTRTQTQPTTSTTQTQTTQTNPSGGVGPGSPGGL